MVLGKIGSFFAGVDFGKVSGLPWAVEFPGLVGRRHPAQLYEAGVYFLIFLMLYLLYFKVLRSRNMVSGKVFFTFLITSSIGRGVLEFFRADPDRMLFWPAATVVSLVVAATSLSALYYFQIRDIRSDLRKFIGFAFGISARLPRRFRI
jgi:phosphatidylglycerol:prolipoprotein diacylglycerol transferase